MKRTIIKIDEALCNGCGACINGCHEGALQLIDGKARIISDLFCDGLGACIGECPLNAIKLEEREAEPYNERKVMERIYSKGENTIIAHLTHLLDHSEMEYYKQGMDYLEEKGDKITLPEIKPKIPCGCPSSRELSFIPKDQQISTKEAPLSQLRQWPVQLHLLNPEAHFLQGTDLVLAADCSAYAFADFHERFMTGKNLAIACPKLDSNKDIYVQKLTAMIDLSHIKSLTVVVMEVPCCGGLLALAKAAAAQASSKITIKQVLIGIKGDIIKEELVVY